MDAQHEREYIEILESELVPALGCTEPIAIAYAAAKARETLGLFPERIELCCSGNIIKNVKGVVVPNSGGLRGVDAAAVLGVVGGDAALELEVLSGVTPEHIAKTRELISKGYFSCKLQENVENLYIVAAVFSGEHSASVTIVNRHTLITEITKDGNILYQNKIQSIKQSAKPKWDLTVADILDFVRTVELTKVSRLLERQIEMNTAIAKAGLTGSYGTQIGRTLMESYGEQDVRVRAQAMAAAGSDARMGGCSLPVVINSGSGNQGMTVSLPVLEYAKEWSVSDDTLKRALLLSNLISIHLKHYIGSLSAFCGAVTAAAGAGAAITYMAGGTDEQIGNTIINTLANVGGIICDGAKASCAAKIASAVNAALLAHSLSMNGRVFRSGEGIIQQDVESTIKSVGYVGRVGMKTTDIEILNIMMDHVKL
jgi:L-cysteine desulfidase